LILLQIEIIFAFAEAIAVDELGERGRDWVHFCHPVNQMIQLNWFDYSTTAVRQR